MKPNRYKVTFTTGQIEIVRASGKEPATILAQAEQIKKGNSYQVKSVEQIADDTVIVKVYYGSRNKTVAKLWEYQGEPQPTGA